MRELIRELRDSVGKPKSAFPIEAVTLKLTPGLREVARFGIDPVVVEPGSSVMEFHPVALRCKTTPAFLDAIRAAFARHGDRIMQEDLARTDNLVRAGEDGSVHRYGIVSIVGHPTGESVDLLIQFGAAASRHRPVAERVSGRTLTLNGPVRQRELQASKEEVEQAVSGWLSRWI